MSSCDWRVEDEMITIWTRTIRDLPTLIFAMIMIAACSQSWVILDVSTNAANEDTQPALIERLQTRQSPGIKTFRHYDLDISRESPGSRFNDSYTIDEIRTPPGKIKIGVVFPRGGRGYNPEVELDVASAHRYQLTWICIPFPYVAVTDANSEDIVAVDSYCPGCDRFIGSPLRPDTECLSHLQPPWMEPDSTSPGRSPWASWHEESTYQRYRDLCYAAEHGLLAAMMDLAFEYEHGFGLVQKDIVRAYVWYRLAAKSGSEQAIEHVNWMEPTQLSSEELEKAQGLLGSSSLGQCVNDVPIRRSREPVQRIQIDNRAR